MESPPNQPLKPQVSLADGRNDTHVALASCFQCRKCSGGCPLIFDMDLLPHHVIRLALMGQAERVLGSRTIWACSGCQTCTTRCPNGIDLAGTMDLLKEEAVKRGISAPQPEVEMFHRFFLEGILGAGGRVPETKLLRRYTFYNMRRHSDWAGLRQNLRLGWKLWRRGRVRLLGPAPLRGKAEITAIFQKAQF